MAQKAVREIKFSEGQALEIALHFARKLEPGPRLFVALEIIERFDENAVADLADPTLQVNLICTAADRLRTLLPSAARRIDEPADRAAAREKLALSPRGIDEPSAR